MASIQPIITDQTGKRSFSCTPIAVQAIIINSQEEILMLSSPTRNADGAWQVISGALEANETILTGVLREVKEEAGPEIQVRPIGVVHTGSFHYDRKVRYAVGVYYVLAYKGGTVIPGDDMVGSRYHWWSLSDLLDEAVKIKLPHGQNWIFTRAIEHYRLWRETEPVNLEII